MKTKVIIENSETTILLTPENEFEVGVIEKCYQHKDKYNVHTIVDAEFRYGEYKKHQIRLEIKEIR